MVVTNKEARVIAQVLTARATELREKAQAQGATIEELGLRGLLERVAGELEHEAAASEARGEAA